MSAGEPSRLWQCVFPAPAKLNLFLHVTGRRPDGYHQLETLFRLIDLADTLGFSPRQDDQVRLLTPIPGVSEGDDLCVRAARMLKQASGYPGGVDIRLEKRIPMGGGLGGGSSDAATTLMALNRLWDVRVPERDLASMALRLGADVPFFLYGENAFAEGVGEQLTAVHLPPAWYLVLVPPVSVPTASVFTAPELTRNTKSIKISGFSGSFVGERGLGKAGELPILAPGFGHNDLQAVVCGRHPDVARHLDWLKGQPQADFARMSGSGSCVFAAFRSEAAALEAAARVPAGMRGLVARGLAQHPIRALLA